MCPPGPCITTKATTKKTTTVTKTTTTTTTTVLLNREPLKIKVTATNLPDTVPGRTWFKVLATGAWQHTIVVKCYTDDTAAGGSSCCKDGPTAGTHASMSLWHGRAIWP